MRLLIAEDDPVSRRVLESLLDRAGYEVIVCADGDEALARLEAPGGPRLAVLDWMMPGKSGPTICRTMRARPDGDHFYLLLLTARTRREDILEGLQAGADDYVPKPFDREELEARLRTGARIVSLQERLAERVHELESALAEVNRLSGLLPICAYCKRIREGDDYWQAVEQYIASRSDAQFSHAICPDCYRRVVQPELDRL